MSIQITNGRLTGVQGIRTQKFAITELLYF